VIILLINGVEAMDNSKSVMFNVFSGVDFEFVAGGNDVDVDGIGSVGSCYRGRETSEDL
jgi:hypothetical protein